MVGLLTLIGVLAAIQIVNREVIPPVAVFMVVFLALAVALRRGAGRRVLIGAAVAALLLVLANLPFALESLVHPETVADFVPTVVALVAGVVVAASGVLAAIGGAPRAARPTWVLAVGVVTASVLVSGAASTTATDDEREAGDIVVDTRDFAYPDTLSVPAGEQTLFVENHDVVRHTLLVDGTDVDLEIPGTTSRRVKVDLSPGEYTYYCDVPGHEAMKGTLEVRR